MNFDNNKKRNECLKILKAMEKNNYSQGIVLYGDFLSKEKKFNQSLKKYLKAAKLNNREALITLTNIYVNKNGDFFNLNKAIKILLKRIKQRDYEAYSVLANIYVDQKNKYYNLNKAQKYIKIGLSNNDGRSQITYFEWLSDVANPLFNVEEAKKMFLKILNNRNNNHSLYKIGTMYLYGSYFTPVNYKNAAKYLYKAFEQGNDDALILIAKNYYMSNEFREYIDEHDEHDKFLKSFIEDYHEQKTKKLNN
jgi:TPR repeat protein